MQNNGCSVGNWVVSKLEYKLGVGGAFLCKINFQCCFGTRLLVHSLFFSYELVGVVSC